MQDGVDEVGLGVNGSGASVRVGGISVGMVKPCLVGGRVEVTKRGGAFVAVSSEETVMHDVRVRAKSRKVRKNLLFIG